MRTSPPTEPTATRPPTAEDLHAAIVQAKLGSERKAAQTETCAVFAAALHDVLAARAIPCSVACATGRTGGRWAHSVVEALGTRFDSMGEFTSEIHRRRARIHPDVLDEIEFEPDLREGLHEDELDGLREFIGRALERALRERLGEPPPKAIARRRPHE